MPPPALAAAQLPRPDLQKKLLCDVRYTFKNLVARSVYDSMLVYISTHRVTFLRAMWMLAGCALAESYSPPHRC